MKIDLPDSELIERIETHRTKAIGSATSGLTRMMVGKEHQQMLSTARAADRVATYSLGLDRVQSAQDWFSWAAVMWGHAVVEIQGNWETLQSEPPHLSRSISRALFSSNTQIPRGISLALLERETDEYAEKLGKDQHYYRPRVWANLLYDRDDQARMLCEEMRTYDLKPLNDRYLAFFDALLEADPSAVEAAITEMNELHAEGAADSSEYTSYMDHSGTAMVLTARQRGLRVVVDSETIPQNLVDSVIPLDEVDTYGE